MLSLISQSKILPRITNPGISPDFGTLSPSIALTNLIVTLWRTAITLGSIALLVMLIYGGLEWVLAGGDKSKVESARNRMTQSVIGLLILVGTVAISFFISGLLGINLLQPEFADNI